MELLEFRSDEQKGFMLRISPEEAYSLINSLSSQLLEKNPNSGRKEYTTNNGEYFSIAVLEPLKKQCPCQSGYHDVSDLYEPLYVEPVVESEDEYFCC